MITEKSRLNEERKASPFFTEGVLLSLKKQTETEEEILE